MSSVSSIWRHPIKALGRESLTSVALKTGECLPWDRVWALAHETSKAKTGEWARCGNFNRAAGVPALMAITAKLNEATQEITLHHPDRPDLTFRPDDAPKALVAWSAPLVPSGRAQPSHIMRLDKHGYPDSPYPSVSLANTASHNQVEQHLGRDLSIHRWRSNIWFDGATPWAEFDWVGKDIAIGNAILRVKEPATRCMSTAANPETGQRDADTLGALEHFGHQEFSVLAEVIQDGTIALGDSVQVL
ncbi:MAG: MOSC domain-containing protein [Ascidiaceihabitans sp.]|nr:MOSC domain-containing protein [Ascidiaceihabitans sp.]